MKSYVVKKKDGACLPACSCAGASLCLLTADCSVFRFSCVGAACLGWLLNSEGIGLFTLLEL